MTSVVLEVEAAVGWQLEAEDGQTVTSEVLVERTVEVVYAASVDAEAVAVASAAVIGQIVVETTFQNCEFMTRLRITGSNIR